MTAWHCQGPQHKGDRLVASPYDRFSKRVTYMRTDGGRRLKERTVLNPNRCKACVMEEAIGEVNDEEQGVLI